MKKCFNFGKMARHTIGIVTVTETEDDLGGRSKSSETVETVHAIVRPVTGYEKFEGERIDSRVSHKIMIRYRDDMSITETAAKKTIRLENREMNVRYVRNLHTDLKREGTHYQEIFAIEGERGAV